MKWIVFFLFVVLLAIVVWIFLLRSNFPIGYTNLVSIFPHSNKVTPVQNNFCKANDLQTLLTSEGAAGNIYVTATIKNIGKNKCEILGDNFIKATYSAKNVKVMQQGQIGPNTIFLAPNQIVYSQVHFPNGPQCSGATQQTPVTYMYKISDKEAVTFLSTSNLPSSNITTCNDQKEITQLDVWSLSLSPLH